MTLTERAERKVIMEIGNNVIVRDKLRRVTSYEYDKNSRYRDIRHKKWEARLFIEPKKCIFLGFRNISCGRTDYDSDCGYTYTPLTYEKVALVILKDGRTNPFYTTLRALKADK